jgi:hypothetical protein
MLELQAGFVLAKRYGTGWRRCKRELGGPWVYYCHLPERVCFDTNMACFSAPYRFHPQQKLKNFH